MKISPLCEYRCGLGEGPLWDAEDGLLYWVDSLSPALYRHRPGSGRCDRFDLPGDRVGSLAVRSGGGLVLAMDQGFYFFDPDSRAIDSLVRPLAGREGQRFNDGKVDPFGRFLAGAMNVDPEGDQDCALYRLGPDLRAVEILDGFQCFNGPCFSPGGDRLYVTGRVDGAIEVFDYAPADRPGNGRVLIDGINPDGATVDAEGFVWSAQWEDACVLRISPEGDVDWRLEVPGEVVTSVMFGGPELDRIYLTTLGVDYYAAAARGARAGMTLVVEGSGFRGRAEPRFKG